MFLLCVSYSKVYVFMFGKKNEGWGWDDLFVSNCFIGSV